ncbi:conserved hypothetical protein [Echinococcus multilocularis]|uniref:Enkurin domain-containing protein n=1 Tax=Echinococcus multilocularis TaxID=6211 RepID=A0A087VY98_ECHMU|nr:conserved hypothetical protein [Echinococcus multilocularis]
MTQNRGAILNLLQWQNTPRSGSVGCNRRSTSVKRDFIRENIRNVHLSVAKDLTGVSSSQIPELVDAGLSIIERYLSDIGLNQDQATQTEFRNNDSKLDQRRKPTTFNKCTQCADCCSTKSPNKQGEFLRAHEKTGQLDTKMALSEIPIKTSARARSFSKVNVPRASSAKDTQLTQGNLNYIRANANAVSNGCVLDRRSTDKQSKRSSSLQRVNFGKLPPYLLRRKKEEEKAAARKKAEERSTTPQGYRRMSEEERGDTLRSLEEAHAETLERLTRALIHMSTNGARNLRARLENRLSDLEEMISVFRKPVVFITLN